MKIKKIAAAVSIAAAALSFNASAADVAADFTIGSNGSGAWSYGYTPTVGGAFVKDTFQWFFGSGSSFAAGWSAGNSASVANPNPSVLYLLGSGPTFNYSTITAPTNTVNLHPGAAGELAVVRWTAPTAGNYSLTTLFRGNDTAGTTSDVHVLRNGVSLFNGAINSFGATQSFAQVIALAAGDKLDFAVGRGSNGTFFNDSTGLAASIVAAVPEPSTYALMLAGLGIVGFAARRRSKTA